MPPIPTLPAYDEATSIREGLQRRLKDLQEYQIPRLRDCKGPLSLQQQFSGELREDVELFQKQLLNLESLVDDQEDEKSKDRVQDWVEEMQEMISQIKKEARGALLTSKRAIDLQHRSHKDELLRSSVPLGTKRQTEGTSANGEDALMRTNNDVTEALRRTTGLMQQELERSVLTTQMLDESSRTLHTTSDLYTTFGTLLQTSKTLITALERSDVLDRLLILSSLVLFLAVSAYVLKKRIIDRSVSLAFWWVKYLPLRATRAPPLDIPSAEAIKATLISPALESLDTVTSLLSSSAPGENNPMATVIEIHNEL